MSSTKSVLATVLVCCSLGANAYLAYRLWVSDPVPAVRVALADEPVVMRTKGGLLEVSTVRAEERFDTVKDHTALGVHLGKTAARIRVPAVYRYHIELAPEWKILLRDKTFIVIAPPVKASLPVAIDTARLESEYSGRWSLLTGTGVVESLQRSITQALAAKAAAPPYIELQREFARKTVKEFVEKWLISQQRWKDASGYEVRIFFSDEPIQALGNLPPPVVNARKQSM
jgi:hypothetical protein